MLFRIGCHGSGVVAMLVGHLDPVTSSGYVEGWAYDANVPLRALVVAVLTRGEE